MKIRIAKEFHWEMSHRLPFHKGLCKNLHGHSYKLRIELVGTTLENGMLLDYYDLKIMVLPLIEKLDHSCICNKGDSILIDFCAKNDFKFLVIEDNTTAENIAGYILSELSPKFLNHKNIESIKIRLYETSEVYAEIEKANL